MRSLRMLACGAIALAGCGVGHWQETADPGDAAPEASARDGGIAEAGLPETDAAPDAAVDANAPDAGPIAPICTGKPSYPAAACNTVVVGSVPAPGCVPPGQSCGGASACAIDESKCGSASTCMPSAENTGAISDFRIRSLKIAAPPALAETFVQEAVITKSIELDAKECGQLGTGSMNWLLRFDATNQTLTTGGALMSPDPFGQGFCFYDHVVGALHVGPVTTCATTAGGVVQSDFIDALNLPIFLNADPNNVIVLPLRQAQLSQIHLSPDQSCIGQFHHEALDSQCGEDPSACDPWTSGGSVGAYITLEEADTVDVADLSESLCAVLTQSVKDPATNRCKRDGNGKIAFKGDYCSTTGAPGGCGDSYWFGATFAASAVKVHDGACP